MSVQSTVFQTTDHPVDLKEREKPIPDREHCLFCISLFFFLNNKFYNLFQFPS